MTRSFVFLQGVASPFFYELGQQLRQAGHKTHRINFCGGDWLFSLKEPHTNYTGTLTELPVWLERQVARHSATDFLLFGDCREMHRVSIAVATRLGIRVQVFEEGYLRPDWITLEQGGVNGYSQMTLRHETILDWAKQSETKKQIQPAYEGDSAMFARAFYDISYRLASAALSWQFPNYQTHRPYNGVLEYAGLARRFAWKWWFEREADRVIAQLIKSKSPYFLFPLQLNADYQIRTHSPFPNVIAAIEKVLTSFASATGQNGAQPVMLVIKNHPLDTGLARYRTYVERRVRALNLVGRVKFIEGGDLNVLLAHTRGVVLVNSTVGLTALAMSRPVLAMGKTIFNREKLTDQRRLAEFWQAPKAPDADFVAAFVAYIKERSQVSGDFYSQSGRRRAVSGCVSRLLTQSP